MTETMADLRTKVAAKLRDTLHGREIDTIEGQPPNIPAMLGIVSPGEREKPWLEDRTILDPSIDFWDEYYKEVRTRNSVFDEIETAIQSLKDDGILEVTMPYGEDAGIFYVEVEPVSDTTEAMNTTCVECGEQITTRPEIDLNYGRYSVVFNLDCPSCDFTETFGQTLNRQ